jgi:hypothetical protein
VRRNSWYTLTNKAAYIATRLFGRRNLKRYRRSEMREPRLVDGTPGSVFFAMETQQYSSRRATRNGHRSMRRTHAILAPVGFRQIDTPRAVYRLLVDRRYDDDTDTTP